MKNSDFVHGSLTKLFVSILCIAHVAWASENDMLIPGTRETPSAVAAGSVRGGGTRGDDLEATNAAIATNPPPPLASENARSALSGARLLGSSDNGMTKTYEYVATGDLRDWTSQSDITLYFTVTEKFTKIESATISLMAYDVDYPVATEHDETYLNGAPLGWMLQGGNESWHANNIPIRPELIKLPETFGGSAINTFFVDVDVLNEYWVTCISEAKLIIKGQVGLEVNASDGTETGGILVTWTAVDGVSSYHITRSAVDGSEEKDLGNVSGTEYLDEDEELEPTKQYNYIVRALTASASTRMRLGASTGAIEGSDKGYYDDNPPLITAMKVAPLFLSGVDKPVYNVKLTWNNYDAEKFAVKEVKFTFTPVEGGKKRKKVTATWGSLEGKTRAALSEETDLAKYGLSFDAGSHGNYKAKLEWIGYDIKKKKTFTEYKVKGWFIFHTKKKLELELDEGCKVYFEKWGGGSGKDHNWWKFWKEDGAIDSHADIFDHVCVIPSSENQQTDENGKMVTAGRFKPTGGDWRYWGGQELTLGDANYTVPLFSKYTLGNCNLFVSDAAAASSRSIRTGDNTPVGTDAQGVKALGVVIAHELSHKRTYEDLYNGRYFLDDGVGFFDIDLDFIQRWLNETTKMLNDSSIVMSSERRKKLESICSALGPYIEEVQIAQLYPEWIASDVDGDGVRDEREDDLKWKLKHNKDDSDSHGLANATTPDIDTPDNKKSDFSNYASYGDNEFIARTEEKDGLGYANIDNDWAYPGNKIATSHMGDSSDTWKSAEPTETANLQTIGGGTAGAMAQGMRSHTLLGTTIGNESLLDYGALLTEGWISQNADYIDTLEILGAETGNASGDGGNGFNELSFVVNVSNRMERSGYFSFTGYLVDESGKGVAKAYAGASLEPGRGQITLRFAGQYIYSSHRNGYALKLVEAANADTDMLTSAGAKTDLATTSRAYAYSEFVHDAVEIGIGISETLDGRDLKITVPLELDGAGEYVAEATLLDEDGNFVATTTTSFATGAESIVFSFSGDDIYASARAGKFHIYSIIVKDSSGVTVKRVWDAYETAAYTRSQFAPSELLIVVKESSFTCAPTHLPDGVTIDSLKFTFEVNSSAGESLDYRVEANLVGTNDMFAASCSSYATIEPGKNEVTLKIDSARLKKNGVEGPYLVRDVLMTPMGDKGNAERFFPVMEAVVAPMDTLADEAFTVGEASVWTAETGDYVCAITVPVTVGRPVTLTLSVMLVDSTGKVAAIGQTVKKYDVACEDAIEYRFRADEVLASGLKGPYTIRFAAISCDIDGVSPMRLTVPDEGQRVEWQYVRYVSCYAADGGNGHSWETAFKNIQDAVDVADDGDVILVANGVYAPFDTRNKSIEVKAIHGCTYTAIDGGNTNRCATLGFEESQTNSVLTGFTLLNGNATTGNTLVLWNCGGGACCGTIKNCRIENCIASKGGGAYYGILEGCIIAENTATTYGGGSYYGLRINCTVVGNTAYNDAGGTYYGLSCNSVVWGNQSGQTQVATSNYVEGDFAFCLASPLPSGTGNISKDPAFRDMSNGDYSLMRSSPCVDSGDSSFVTMITDIAGNARVSGNAVDIGAYELRCSQYTPGFTDFAYDDVEEREGRVASVSVFGGLSDKPCTVQLYLTYNTAAAADLDLANGTVDGVKPKGGLKFPLTLSWAAGETGEKVVEIPIKADAAIEDNEFFTLQLCDPAGMQLGDYRVCTVTIQDRNTKATLADGIGNQSLKPSTSGAGKWYAVESWMADPAEPDRTMFVQSPDLLTGSTSTFSFGSIKGAGSLYFDLKFIGETGNGASYVEVYSGKNKLGTITCSANGEGWNTWHVDTETTGTHNFTLVLTQGADRNSHVRISNVVWRPSDTSSYSEINISAYPDGAGVVSGAGTYANGTKINFNAIPRPGYTFVGWYRTSGALFGSKTKMSVNMTGSAAFIAVFSKAPYVRGLADPASAGKVSGSGPCASGKKVTLKATANKGYVLAGWFNERDDRISQTASLVVDNSAKPAKPSATSYVISNVVSDVTYYARFVTVAEDVASIACSVGGLVFPEGDSPTLDASVPCGVRLDWPVLTSGLSQTSAKVAGLPAGLKFNAVTGCIEGAPTTPSKTDKTGNVVPSAVKITVTTAGKSSKVFLVNLTVTAMPAAVVGTFNGFVSEYDSDEHIYYRGSSYASFTLTTTAAGKITAKAVSPKGTVSFTANCWDEIVDEGQYAVMLTARTGEMLYLYVDSVPEYWNGVNHSYGYLMGGSYGSEWLYVEAQRSSFLKAGKDYEHPDAVELAKAMQGTYKFDATYTGDGEYTLVRSTAKTATLSVTIKNTGAVTVAGTLPGTSYKVSGAGVLRVYPLEKMADVYVCGASGKIVNIMIELDASIGDDGSVALTGYAFVNLME